MRPDHPLKGKLGRQIRIPGALQPELPPKKRTEDRSVQDQPHQVPQEIGSTDRAGEAEGGGQVIGLDCDRVKPTMMVFEPSCLIDYK